MRRCTVVACRLLPPQASPQHSTTQEQRWWPRAHAGEAERLVPNPALQGRLLKFGPYLHMCIGHRDSTLSKRSLWRCKEKMPCQVCNTAQHWPTSATRGPWLLLPVV